MKIISTELIVSAVRRSQYPNDDKCEILLLGRSNVGKSSFINTICNQKHLARTSQTPGKTKNLNFYLINDCFYFVDVPGYGYASVSKTEQKKFGLMIEEYLQKRENLKRTFLFVDLRHKPTNDDVLMYKFLKYYKLPVTIIATKSDKVGVSKIEKAKKLILDTLKLESGDLFYTFSSFNKEGKDKILEHVEDLLKSQISDDLETL